MLDQHILGYGGGQRLRDLQAAMALPLGAGLSLAACPRLVLRVRKQTEACKQQPLARPPPSVLVDGMWGKSAYPTAAISEESQGRRRAGKRKQQRVVLRALGVWPDGPWESGHGQMAEGATADTGNAFFRALSLKGVTEQTTAVVVSDGSPGLASALDDHLYGVAPQRCIFHKIKQLAASLVFGALAGAAAAVEAPSTRKAKRQRKKAIWAEAGWGDDGEREAAIRARAEVFRDHGHAREPKAVANVWRDFDKTFASLTIDFPLSLASRSRTTNLLARFHKEMRRKQRDMGMLQSEQGCETLWSWLSMRETAKQRAALSSRL